MDSKPSSSELRRYRYALLGFPENNLPISDTAQWEMKTHRVGSSSLVTLFHMEPQPRKAKVVVTLLLPQYGWPDQAGRPAELSSTDLESYGSN